MVAVWWDSYEPWVHEIEPGRVDELLADRPIDAGVFEIDGIRVSTDDDLFECFSQAFGFPSYFGRNWAALRDCLDDLSWMVPQRHVLLIVRSWPTLLGDDPEGRALLKDVLRETGSN